MNGLFGRIWFAPERPSRLAAIRILVGVYALAFLLLHWNALIDMSLADPEGFAPVGVAKLLGRPLDPELFSHLLKATVGLGALFLLGVRFRLSGPLFAAALLAVLTYRASWSVIEHDAHLLCLHVLVLGFTPAANALSFDSWTRARLGTRFREFGSWPFVTHQADWRFGWPVRLLGAVTLLVYALPALARVLGPSGAAWDYGATLRGVVLYDSIQADLLGGGASPVARTIAQSLSPMVVVALGIAVVVIGLSAPLMLLSQRAARLWCVLVWAVHAGIWWVMGELNPYQLSFIAFAPFFPVDRLFPRPRHTERHRRKVFAGPVEDHETPLADFEFLGEPARK